MAHEVYGVFKYAGHGAAPAGVDGGDSAGGGVCEEYWDAVGRHDREGRAGRVCCEGVGVWDAFCFVEASAPGVLFCNEGDGRGVGLFSGCEAGRVEAEGFAEARPALCGAGDAVESVVAEARPAGGEFNPGCEEGEDPGDVYPGPEDEAASEVFHFEFEGGHGGVSFKLCVLRRRREGKVVVKHKVHKGAMAQSEEEGLDSREVGLLKKART